MSNLLDRYKTYIEEASFYGLTIQAAHERDIQYVEVKNVIEIKECDDKDVFTH
jgi:pyridoxine 5'-phosphate synthase PdxJ